MTNKIDYIFACKKCEHNLYINKTKMIGMKLDEIDCPECGEEGHMNWLYAGEGCYDYDYGVRDLIIVDIFTPNQTTVIHHKFAHRYLEGRDKDSYVLLPKIAGFPVVPLRPESGDIKDIQEYVNNFFARS